MRLQLKIIFTYAFNIEDSENDRSSTILFKRNANVKKGKNIESVIADTFRSQWSFLLHAGPKRLSGNSVWTKELPHVKTEANREARKNIAGASANRRKKEL